MKSEVHLNVFEPITALRKRLGLTQKALADRIGVCENYVWMLENGRKPGRKVASQISLLEVAEPNNPTAGPPEKKATIYVDESAPRAVMRENPSGLTTHEAAVDARLERIECQMETVLGLLGASMRDGLPPRKKVG